MARARNLKPGFFKNEELAEVAFEYRLLFAGLWTLADREGRLEDRPKKIRMEIFPADNVDCEAGLQALAGRGLIVRYTAEGAGYIWIPTFLEHQNPHIKEAASVIPAYQGSDEHLPRLVPAPTQAQTSPAESLLLESLSSESRVNPLVRLAPDAGKSSKQLRKAEALQLLEFLNTKAQKHFRDVPANLRLIEARLADGIPAQDLKTLIVLKCREWLGTDREKFLRPETLFNLTKCNSYLGEIPPEERDGGQPCNAPVAIARCEPESSPVPADGSPPISHEASALH